MLDLDFEVAKAVSATSLLERALHDRGRWEMSWAGQVAPVERVRTESGVTMRASFDPSCLTTDERVLHLLVEGEIIAVSLLDRCPGDGGFTFEWRLSVLMKAHA